MPVRYPSTHRGDQFVSAGYPERSEAWLKNSGCYFRLLATVAERSAYGTDLD